MLASSDVAMFALFDSLGRYRAVRQARRPPDLRVSASLQFRLDSGSGFGPASAVAPTCMDTFCGIFPRFMQAATAEAEVDVFHFILQKNISSSSLRKDFYAPVCDPINLPGVFQPCPHGFDGLSDVLLRCPGFSADATEWPLFTTEIKYERDCQEVLRPRKQMG